MGYILIAGFLLCAIGFVVYSTRSKKEASYTPPSIHVPKDKVGVSHESKAVIQEEVDTQQDKPIIESKTITMLKAIEALESKDISTPSPIPNSISMPDGKSWIGVLDHQRWTQEGKEYFHTPQVTEMDLAKWMSLCASALRVNAKHPWVENLTPGDWWGIDGFDCQCFALAYKKQLLGEGIEPGALRLATCKTPGGYHAVLLVFTDKGVYTIDNMVQSGPYPWKQTGYTEWAVEIANGKWKILDDY